MRKLWTLAFFSFFLMSVCCPTDVLALMRIIEDPSSLGVTMSFAEQDDADDTTPPSSASNHFITINNHSRRYVGICIDQVYSGATVPIENGTDDRYMTPATEILSYKFVEEFFEDAINWTKPDYPPATRTYALPMPDVLPYGSEVRFPIRVVGPTIYKRLPYLLNDPAAPRCFVGRCARNFYYHKHSHACFYRSSASLPELTSKTTRCKSS